MLNNWMQAIVATKRINSFFNCSNLATNVVEHRPNDLFSVQIVNGTFTWCDQIEILKNIGMNIEKGELVAVVGAVGSGRQWKPL